MSVSFQEYTGDLRRQLAQREKKEENVLKCTECNSTWFAELNIAQYEADHNIAVGQSPPLIQNKQGYIILKCVRCETLLQPRVQLYARDYATDGYKELIEALDGKGDTRKQDEVQAKKL